MRNDFINKTLHILNHSSSAREKQEGLRKEKAKRRGKNRAILSVIIELLDKHSLSIDITDDLFIIDLKDFTEKEYISLATISHRCTNTYFKATSLEVLWLHYRKIELANKAMTAYWEALKTESDDYIRAALASSVCRIYNKTKSRTFDVSKFQRFCTDCLIPSFPSSENYPDIVLKALLLGSFCKDIERYTIELIKKRTRSKEYISAIFLSEILVEIYKKEKRGDDKQVWLCNLAKYHEAAANLLDWNDPQSARRIIHLIQKAMQLWTASAHKDSSNERKRLAKRIEPVKKLSLDSIKSIPGGEFDLTETINHMHAITKEASFEECIWNFIHAVKLIKPAELKSRRKKHGFFFSSFFATTILDSEGRIKCIIPALRNASSNDEKNVCEHEAERDYTLYADAFISRYLHIIKTHFTFNEENLRFIVDSNAFIPENRKQSFLKGLVAGFNYDYITALSILMPQIENAIRELAHHCGAVVYKTKDNGVEECLSLDSILKLPELESRLDPTLLFNLKVFYTSDYGFGMRNTVVHGLVSDAELNSFRSLIVWWFTLHICCIFSPALISQISRTKKEST